MTKVKTALVACNNYECYALQIPDNARELFPENGTKDKNTFQIMNNEPKNRVWVSPRHPGKLKLDHIHVTHTDWWKGLKPHPKIGGPVVIKDFAEIEVTESDGVPTYQIH